MSIFGKKRIFLDYASATPILPEAERVMKKYYSENFYNPGAIYFEAESVRRDIESFRAKIARLLGAQSKEIIFTSGGTESDNLAILGVLEKAREKIGCPELIISAIEHPAVFSAAQEWERRGGKLSVAGVDGYGRVKLDELEKMITPECALISVSLANSEIGVIQPIAKIGRLVRAARKKYGGDYPLLHTDASAAAPVIRTNIEALQCDLMTLDAAKIYGPKGAGILALRRGVDIHPLLFGGGQERGRRSGTLAPALIAGMVKALELVEKDKEKEGERLLSLRLAFITKLSEKLPQAIVNGPPENFLPSLLSVSVPGILSEFLLLKMEKEGVLASVGSACSYDEKTSGSPVIRAIGRTELSESTVRFSFGRMTTKREINRATDIFCRNSQNMVK